MSKKQFTPEEVNILSRNQYVKKVTAKGITYTDEFKQLFITENEQGKFPRAIFEDHGFSIKMLGMNRIESAGKRWRAAYRENGANGLRDTRLTNSGRTSSKELSLQEKYLKLLAEHQLLQAENELRKKMAQMERQLNQKRH